MVKKIFNTIIISIFILGISQINSYAIMEFIGGEGTELNPYEITTGDQLNNVRNHLNSHFILKQDIDLSGYDNWNPIMNFSGRFDGDGYKIKNLRINNETEMDIGLFGSSKGTIKNIILKDVDIIGETSVGSLVGSNTGVIENIYITGRVSGTANYNTVGGLVGNNSGTITKCCFQGQIKGEYGGILIGGNSGTVENSYAIEELIANNNIVGNLVRSNFGIVRNCYSLRRSEHGLVGGSFEKVENSYYNIGLVTEVAPESGKGKTTKQMKQESTYSGWDFSEVWQIEENKTYPHLNNLPPVLVNRQTFLDGIESDNIFVLEFDESVSKGTGYISIHKLSDDTVVDSIDVTDSNKVSIVDNIVNIKATSIFENNEEYYILIDDTCFKGTKEKYYLGISNKNNWTFYFYKFGAGNGSSNNPYEIETKEDFNELRNFSDNYFILNNDINWDGNWEPIEYFQGTIDGNGYKIKNLKINRDGKDYTGLIGLNNGTIKNISLVDVNIRALRRDGENTGGAYVGALVAYNKGIIENCNSSGSVKGCTSTGGLAGNNSGGLVKKCYSSTNVEGQKKDKDEYVENYVGGCIGRNTAYGKVESSYSTGNVVGDKMVGGFIGNQFNNAHTINCYSTGTVIGNEGVGGLIGRNYIRSSIKNCYSTGNVVGNKDVGGLVGKNYNNGTVETSYYDTETSGQSDIGKGEPKTTIQMKEKKTYLEWDFNNVWRMLDEQSYPKMKHDKLKIVELNPKNESTNVAINKKLSIIFDENIKLGTGYITIYKYSDDTVVQNIYAKEDALIVNGENLIINLTENLDYNTKYYMKIDETAVYDELGDNFIGIDDKKVWSFKTAQETINPVILETDPANTEEDVLLDKSITINFSEDILLGDTSNIVLKKDETVVDYVYNVTKNRLSIDPVNNLEYGSLYTLKIPKETVTDVVYNHLEEDYIVSFTTKEYKKSKSKNNTFRAGKDINGDLEINKTKNNSFPTINLDKDIDSRVPISLKIIKEMKEEKKTIIVENRGIKIEFKPGSIQVKEALNQELSKTLEYERINIILGAEEVTELEKEKIIKKANLGETTGLFEVSAKIYDLTANLVKEKNGVKIEETIDYLNKPVEVTLDLSDLELRKEEIKKLIAIGYEKDEKGNVKLVKLGGKYNKETKLFTFYTDKFSLYSVVKAENMVEIDLSIGKLEVEVNKETKKSDVAPKIINNRTMVPVRFIAENMGANVSWNEETREVTIELDGQTMNMVIDKEIEGFDTPPTIVDGRTLVPMRYISEKLGAYVMWFPEDKKVHIVK